MSAAPYALLAAGGTGGHMFPAQALAEALLAKGWRVDLSTDERGARYTGGFPDAVTIREVNSATFARGGVLNKLRAPFKIIAGIRQARARFKTDRPDVVVGFGGYPTIPALSAAVLEAVPRLIHEQNGVMGRVNHVFASRVDLVACGIWPTEMPKGTTAQHIGNPVRASITKLQATPYVAPKGTGPINILVFGGSQGARILSDVLPNAIGALPEDIRARITVTQQARTEDVARVSEAYSGVNVTADIQTFFTDMPEHIANAQLVIARAGASSVADLTVIGRPAILVPYAAATGDHQTANAAPLVKTGAAIMLSEKDFTAETLTKNIAQLISNPSTLTTMADASRSAGLPDATDRLVAAVEKIATSQPSST